MDDDEVVESEHGNSSLRDQIGKFADALVLTRKDVQEVQRTLKSISTEFKELKGETDLKTQTVELAVADISEVCTDIKAWREGAQVERQNLEQYVSSTVASQIAKLTSGLQHVESQLPHLRKSFENGPQSSGTADVHEPTAAAVKRLEKLFASQTEVQEEAAAAMKKLEAQMSGMNALLTERSDIAKLRRSVQRCK
jgi:chromosome segregation ATPase